MKKKIYMETTKKEPEQTISEIMALLKSLGVRDVLTNYDEQGNVSAVSFRLRRANNDFIPYRLPADHRPLWQMAIRGETRYIKTEQQARRVAWRQVYRWIQAQMAMIEIDMVSPYEIFMPYMLVSANQTLFDKYIGGDLNLLEGGK